MEIRLQRLGEGADSGKVVQILVKEGDRIEKDQAIIELENEKAVAPIPSPKAGTVEKIHVSEGQEIAVGDLIVSLSLQEKPPRKEEEPEGTEEEKTPKQEDESTARKRTEGELVRPGVPPPAAPSVRRIAREAGIDLHRVRGSQRGGRIVMSDLRAYVRRLQEIAFENEREPATETSPAADFEEWGPVRREAMSGVRKAISRKLTQTWRNVPQVTQFGEADVTGLLALKKQYEAAYEAKGVRLTPTAFVVRTLATLLQAHPIFNASLDTEAEQIVYKEYIHIGIAMDTERGLLVPVMHDVSKKTMFDIAKELGRLAEKARGNKLSVEETHGGTFTVSNQGGIGGAHFTPIVNLPEAAILGIGRAAHRPLVRGDKIEPRMLVPLALSYDHRLIDGARAAEFIRDFVERLEAFSEKEVKL